jgi:hypothetical protein
MVLKEVTVGVAVHMFVAFLTEMWLRARDVTVHRPRRITRSKCQR